MGVNASNSKNLYCSMYPSKWPYILKVSFTEGTTNTANNTSPVNLSGSITSGGAKWSSSYDSYLELYWYDNKTKTEKLIATSGKFKSLGVNASQSVSETITVTHNDDGTLSGYAKVKFIAGSTSGGYCPNSNDVATSSTDLTKIARATSCPNLDGYIESSAPIVLNPASSSFKHRLYYSYNGKKGYYPSSTDFFANTGSLDLDDSFYEKTPKAIGTGSLTLYTYDSEDNLIGSKTGTITIRCDSNKCKPLITASIIDNNSTTIALTGDNTKLIKGYSNAEITYEISAQNGATITSKSINDNELEDSPCTLEKVTTGNFEIIAIDSREFSNTEKIEKELIEYIPLAINFNAFRPTPTGSEIQVNFSGNYFNDTFGKMDNTLELSWKYRILRAEEWIDGGTFVKDSDYKVVDNKFFSGTGESASDISLSTTLFLYNNAYEIGIFYKDKLVDTFTTKPVPRGKPVINWEDELVNVNGVLTINDQEVLEYEILEEW